VSDKIVELEKFGSLARITLNRQETYNAFDYPMGQALVPVMEDCGRDPSIRAVILTGSGRAFCSGGDVRAMGDFLDRSQEPPSVFIQGLTKYLHGLVVEMRRMPKPVLGAINGVAAGAGLSLALACDLRLASAEARFTLAYTGIAVVPDGGATFFLPRLVGPARAAEMIFTNPTLSAEQARDWGLINRVVPAESLAEEAMAAAQRLAEGPTLALARAKELLNRTWDSSLEAQLEEERRGIMAAFMTRDFQTGVRAFLAKQPARFRGD